MNPLPSDAVPQTLGARAIAIIRLAVPVMLTRLGLLLFTTLDTLMLGHLGADELAYFAISVPPQVTVLTVGFGLLSGTLVLIAQARGAGRMEEIGHVFKVVMVISLVVGVAAALGLMRGEALLTLLGQSPDIARGGGVAIQAFAIGLPAVLLGAACSMLLEAMGRPKIVLAVTLAGLGLKVLLNLWLLEPPGVVQGATGANLATSLARWAMLAALLAYIVGTPAIRRLGLFTRVRRRKQITLELMRYGLPSGLSQGLESTAFGAMSVFAGWLGTHAIGSYQIALNLVAMAFMMALGLSTATSVQVGMAFGARDRRGAEASGWLGTAMIALYAFALGCVLYAFDTPIARLYTHDPDLMASAALAIAICGFILLPDGLQGVLMGALRGLGDVNWPSVMHLFSFWAVAVPLAHHLAFTRGWGTDGLLWGLMAGLVVAAGLLAIRFALVSRRLIPAT